MYARYFIVFLGVNTILAGITVVAQSTFVSAVILMLWLIWVFNYPDICEQVEREYKFWRQRRRKHV